MNVEDPVAGVVGRRSTDRATRSSWPGPTCLPLAFDPEDEERVVSINYTSGTTGRPKGVMYTHRGACLNALGEMCVHGLGRDSVYPLDAAACSTATAGAFRGP